MANAVDTNTGSQDFAAVLSDMDAEIAALEACRDKTRRTRPRSRNV